MDNTQKGKTVWERTPDARYRQDNSFRQLVDMMEAHIHATNFTPMEMREAALLACINYERRHIRLAHGYTMTDKTARYCYSTLEQLYEAIKKDERPFDEFA